MFMVASGPILWETKRQDTVVLSTVETEFMALSRVIAQALWISKYFEEIRLLVTKPVLIYADNNGAIALSSNDKNHRRTKHIDVQHYFVKEYIKANDITFQYIPSSMNLADFLTKSLPRDTLWRTIASLGLTQ